MFVCVSDASTFTKHCVLAGMLLLWFLLRLKVKGQRLKVNNVSRFRKIPVQAKKSSAGRRFRAIRVVVVLESTNAFNV